MKQRLNHQQRQCIAEHYQSHVVYQSLTPMGLKWMQERQVPLHPAELFYVVLYYLDCLRYMERGKRTNYCRYYLWLELKQTLDLQPEGDTEKRAEELALAEVLQTFIHLLTISHASQWLSVAQAIGDSLMEHISMEEAAQLQALLCHGTLTVGEEELRSWLKIYLKCNLYLSNDIAGYLKALKAEELPRQQQENEYTSSIRIAPNCKSKVLVMLDAMYNAGWLVNEQGQRLTNRDKALNEILSLAFGEKNWTVIRNSICPNKVLECDKRNAGFFRELEAHMSKKKEKP